MKKAYVKPEMFYEDFSLSRNIAACSIAGEIREGGHMVAANHNSKSTCHFDLGGYTIFATVGICDQAYEPDGDTCYQTSTEGNTYFCS